MRIVGDRWCLTSRKHVWIPYLAVGFFLGSGLLSAVVGQSPGEKSVQVKKEYRRHSVEDDEIHDVDLVQAVVQSLADWNGRRAQRQRNGRHRVKRDEEVVCYGELGCFRDEGPFDYLDMLPTSPEEISTRFLLYTRSNRQTPETFSYFNYTTIFNSNFNATAPTKVIIHGFGSTCNRIWASEMRLTLLSVVSGTIDEGDVTQRDSNPTNVQLTSNSSSKMGIDAVAFRRQDNNSIWKSVRLPYNHRIYCCVECNVICVDWENGATLPNYVRAAVNTRLVGKQVALLISWLNVEMGTRTQDFHLIGFSLGAHVAGFAGHDLKNLSRITGLDPAGPLYESYDTKVRLDSSDALFVDVIHSNGDSLLMGGLGSWEPMGHVDFYPNGGRVQKGCSNLFLGAVRDFLWSGSDADGRSLCNHRRAYKFFTESISPRCPFPAFACESYEKFMQGGCFTWDTAHCGNMGYFADRLPNPKQGLLYLVTREDEPFCANQYLIAVESSPSTAPISTYGGIEAVLIGHDFINETFLITKTLKESMVPGNFLQRMIVAHPAITEPIQIQLKYTAYQGWLYSGISRWSMDSLVLTNAYGKSVSFCARLLLPSGIPVTIRLKPGMCLGRFPPPTNGNSGRPGFPGSQHEVHQTGGDMTVGVTGPKIPYNPNDTVTPVETDLSVMKPPAMTLIPVGTVLNRPAEDSHQAGPPYIVNPTWPQWHPVSPFTPVETYPHVDDDSVITTERNNPTQTLPPALPSDQPLVKLRICLLAGSQNESTTVVANVTLNNLTCLHEDEGTTTGAQLMSNSALGQIASYHQEILKEDELFHHGNTIEVDNPSSTDLAIPMPPESFWSAVHNKTLPTTSNDSHGPTGDPPIPPHLSYILQQLESQGLGPGPKVRFGDRLSPAQPDGNGNYLRGLLGREVSHQKFQRRLVPSSRALKMRPVSLTPAGSNSNSHPGTAAVMPGNHRRQAKILEMNFSPTDSHGHFGPRKQDLRWLQPPLRIPYLGAGTSPIFYVTKHSSVANGKGSFLIPHFTDGPISHHGGRVKLPRLLQPKPPLTGLSSETPPSPQPHHKSYFEDIRQSLTTIPRWAQLQQQTSY